MGWCHNDVIVTSRVRWRKSGVCLSMVSIVRNRNSILLCDLYFLTAYAAWLILSSSLWTPITHLSELPVRKQVCVCFYIWFDTLITCDHEQWSLWLQESSFILWLRGWLKVRLCWQWEHIKNIWLCGDSGCVCRDSTIIFVIKFVDVRVEQHKGSAANEAASTGSIWMSPRFFASWRDAAIDLAFRGAIRQKNNWRSDEFLAFQSSRKWTTMGTSFLMWKFLRS